MGRETSVFADTYVILEQLGAGSGGIVYKAYHKRLEKEVVLKKLKSPEGLDIETSRKEVDILKNLNHMYLPQVLDFFIEDGEIYTVMSYVPGKSFKELLDEGRRFSVHQLSRWGMQLCSALNYLHSQRPPVIHGDIKPSNVMLTPEGNICLIDFNISFFLDENTVLGYTDGYTSPEQYIIALDAESARSIYHYSSIDEKSDIYSAGATLYHLATGKKARKSKVPIDLEMLTRLTGEPFAQVIAHAMELDPKKRYRNVYEMFQALQGIGKKDERYRRLIIRQQVIRFFLVLLLGGFIVLGGYGIHTVRLEKTARYNDLVAEQTQCRKDLEYEEEERLYEEAVKLLPKEIESYYQHAKAFYDQEEYEACISFIDYDILENEKVDLLDARMADVLFLKADSHFELEDYEESVEAYEALFQYGGYDADYYRDYAIVLAYDGKAVRAQETLDDATRHGLKEDSIYYAKGEIAKAEEEYDEARLAFDQCIEVTEDDTLKARAYVMLSDVYREQGDRRKEREVLVEAREVLPAGNQIMILQRLAQVDLDLADETGENAYREEAIEALTQVTEQGYATYDTYDSLAILYQKQGNLELAQSALETMEEKYGIDYNIWMRRAFLEIDRQELKDNRGRDYTTFAQYYEKAEKLYEKYAQHNESDDQMELLEQIYEQVKAGGWL